MWESIAAGREDAQITRKAWEAGLGSHAAEDPTPPPQSGGHLIRLYCRIIILSPTPVEYGPYSAQPSALWEERPPGLGEKQCSGLGSQGRSGQAGVGLLLLFQSESISLELPHPWCSAPCWGSGEPQRRSQNHKEHEEQQPLGQDAEVSGLFRRIARIWGRRR